MKVKSLLLKAGENPEVVYVDEQEICSKIGCEKCMVNGYLGNGGAININYESDAKEKGKPYNCTFAGVIYFLLVCQLATQVLPKSRSHLFRRISQDNKAENNPRKEPEGSFSR